MVSYWASWDILTWLSLVQQLSLGLTWKVLSTDYLLKSSKSEHLINVATAVSF